MFNIGDRVRIRKYDSLPSDVRTIGNSRACGRTATVTDRMMSAYQGKIVYRLSIDGFKADQSLTLWPEEALAGERDEFSVQITREGGEVYAILLRTAGDETQEVARGRGFVYGGNPAYAVAQAASYAAMKLMNTVKRLCEDEKEEGNA